MELEIGMEKKLGLGATAVHKTKYGNGHMCGFGGIGVRCGYR